MWPRIGPLPSYGICYLIAFLLHYLVCWRIARRSALRWWVWLTVSVLFSAGSILGARLLYDLSHSQFAWDALLNPRHYTHGGFWGGLLAYFALAVPAVLWLTTKRRAALDLVALSIPIPFFFGKLGCFLQGCCHGGPTSLPWAVVYPQNTRGTPAGTPLHPTQLYEMLVMLGVLLAFRKLNRSEAWRGTMIPWFLAIYGFGRAFCDTLRGDLAKQVHVGPLTLTQLVCLGAASLSVAFLLWWRHHLHQRPTPPCLPDLAPGGS